MSAVKFIAYTGGSGMGKTTLAHERVRDARRHGQTAVIVTLDNYYHPVPEGADPETHNWDTLGAFDIERLRTDIATLRARKPICATEHDYSAYEDRAPQLLGPADIVVVEGLHVLALGLDKEYDEKYYVEADKNTALMRRLARDQQPPPVGRGYTRENIIKRWTDDVWPVYETEICKYRDLADEVIDNSHYQSARSPVPHEERSGTVEDHTVKDHMEQGGHVPVVVAKESRPDVTSEVLE